MKRKEGEIVGDKHWFGLFMLCVEHEIDGWAIKLNAFNKFKCRNYVPLEKWMPCRMVTTVSGGKCVLTVW